MKKILFLLLFLVSLIKRGDLSNFTSKITSKILASTNSFISSQNQTDFFDEKNPIYLPHLFRRKRVKKIKSPFKTKSNMTSYDADYNENFVKLIENFLLKHLKKIIKNQSLGYDVANYHNETPDNEIFAYKFFQDLKKKYNMKSTQKISTFGPTTNFTSISTSAMTTSTSRIIESFTLHNKFKNCNFESANNDGSEPIVECESSLETRQTTKQFTSHVTTKKSIAFLKNATEKSKEMSFNDLKQAVIYYKNNFSYFVSSIILLSTISIVLFIISFTCCAIVCKQRSSLNAYKDNEFFTYYNKNLPIIASVSSFSLSGTTTDRLDRLVDRKISTTRPFYDRNLTESKELLLSNPHYLGFDHHKLSTRCFGNKSSLTLYQQQTPNIQSMQSNMNDKEKCQSLNKNLIQPNETKQNSFRIMNSIGHKQAKYLDMFTQSPSNKQAGEFLTQNGGVISFERSVETPSNGSKINIHDSVLKRFESNASEHRNESLIKEHLNFINGIRQQNLTQKNSFSAEQERQIELELRQKRHEQKTKKATVNNDDDDDEDIVLESDINNRLIENYDKYLSYSDKKKPNVKNEDLACIEIIESLSSNFNNKENCSDPLQTVFTSTLKNNLKNNLSKKTSFQVLQQKSLDLCNNKKLNDNCIQNDQARDSPNYIRERYYQILRDQVFPFLQRPPQQNFNINQSAKHVQGYSNDVLY